jgi:hypothetical protein
MRKLSISIGLWFLLLAGQYGAVLHELSHLVRASSTDVTVHADGFADKTCELCLGYSQLSNPASPCVPMFVAELPASQVGIERSVAETPVDLLTPRSRGPPASALNS